MRKILIVSALAGLSACAEPASDQTRFTPSANFTQAGDRSLQTSLYSSEFSQGLLVYGADGLAADSLRPAQVQQLDQLTNLELATRDPSDLQPTDDPIEDDRFEDEPGVDPVQGDTLTLGIPLTELGRPYLFGGAVTQVSDGEDETLGRLKLSALDPIYGELGIARDGDDFFLVFAGCLQSCTETSTLEPLINFPILNATDTHVVVDFRPIGSQLNLVQIVAGNRLPLTPVSSRTVAVDLEGQTVLFDIASQLRAGEGAEQRLVDFKARWYLQARAPRGTQFQARQQVAGVGFFENNRSAATPIARFAAAADGAGPVKYLVKNVPPEFINSFTIAFDDWNELFGDLNGSDIFDFEFIASDDPRADAIVAGDIRYNVLEWDLDNAAPYGGFGPSVSDPLSGEIISANVLVQGPMIVDLYERWFESTGQQQDGDRPAAPVARRAMDRDVTFELSLGDLAMTIPAQDPRLSEPDVVARRLDFVPIPTGFDYNDYMFGYWRELVAHELGHNLGLRHNFRGNLGAAVVNPRAGEVSRSVMEYLGRGYRHLNLVGPYDRMAIAYGYLGELPQELNWFCTDGDVAASDAPTRSAECSRDDATADPVSVFEETLGKALGLAVAVDTPFQPEWALSDLERPTTSAAQGLAAYHGSAERVGEWTNWSRLVNRPEQPVLVRQLIRSKLNSIVCDQTLDRAVANKATLAARQLAGDNLRAQRALVQTTIAPFGVTLTCE